MAFEPKTWANGKDGATPITAAELNRIENGIATIELTPGLKGDKGDKGDPGKKGDPGADGTDGFPTESQWNELVDRVAALEAEPPA